MSNELNTQINEWRNKVLEGTVSLEENIAIIKHLRADRVGAAIASEKSRKKAVKTAIPTADDLLKELEGL